MLLPNKTDGLSSSIQMDHEMLGATDRGERRGYHGERHQGGDGVGLPGVDLIQWRRDWTKAGTSGRERHSQGVRHRKVDVSQDRERRPSSL